MEVVSVEGGLPDMPIGQTGRKRLVGNHIVIEADPERYVLLAHLKQGSVRVSEGETVRRGQPIAACGNSGNTSEPHLHLQVQNHADFHAPDLRTFPILFRNVVRIRGGRATQEAEADVRRNDRIRTADSP